MTHPRPQVHAYFDDALGEHDGVALAALVRSGERSPAELIEAAIARVEAVDPELHAVQVRAYDRARATRVDTDTLLAGVPTFIKDNTDVLGLPTNHGTACFVAKPAKHDSPVTTQYLASGMVVLGKTRLPEFGFNAATEYRFDEPVRNPWNTDYSPGASSGGSGALVAAGAVPISHANDGGGSIRIPAACNGLVGLKPSRGRFADGPQAKSLPINVVAEGVVTRSVRDTAAYAAACEQYAPAKALLPIGHVQSAGSQPLRIGLVIDSPSGAVTDSETRAAVERTAKTLEAMGHYVDVAAIPIDTQFADDFVAYWAMLAFLSTRTARLLIDRHFNAKRADGLTLGLRSQFQRHLLSAPGALRRLKKAQADYEAAFAAHDAILSPVLSHVPPKIGYLSPQQPFEQLMDRLRNYVAFTPLNNVSGGPAIAIPAGRSAEGVPIGAHLSAKLGDEAVLLRLAYGLEDAQWGVS
ncbi:amidase [Jatrophihabitans sp.]|uniref:amidase n=1 Tax=Jatrophihabitans sp. TaxID=1932789 RepID=UPI0030C744BE|nr:amidase [Jatrophihabitans sp.]